MVPLDWSNYNTVEIVGGVGGAGGSGIVIFAYPDFSYGPIISEGLTYTIETSRPGYKLYKITGGAGTIEFH